MADRRKVIGITGGIGSGKSVVSRILRLRGYEVFDCDYEAKRLYSVEGKVREEVMRKFGPEVFLPSGDIYAAALASIVFSDGSVLRWLEELVHSEIHRLIGLHAASSDPGALFVESAIMMKSHLYRLCDEVWLVESPLERRISRTMARDASSREKVLQRIKAQENEFTHLAEKVKVSVIHNDSLHSLLLSLPV